MKGELKNVRQGAAAIRVPYPNLERLAGALNGLPDDPPAPPSRQRPALMVGLPGFGLDPRGVQLRDSGQRNVDPWAPILALFAALSESVRVEEERRAEQERQRAPRPDRFAAVRALRFGETALTLPRAPGTKQQATEYLMRWLAEQWSPTVSRVVKCCEVCHLWFVDRSKPHHAKRCASCRPRYWTRPRRRDSRERSAARSPKPRTRHVKRQRVRGSTRA